MRVFVTGATGWVGSAVVEELIAAGHEVMGLARSEQSAAALAEAGASVARGAVEDLEVLRAAAAEADAVIHTAFNHDWSRFAENCAADKAAIETLGATLEGTDKPLIVTSGVALLSPGRLATEETASPPVTDSFPRASEAVVKELNARGIRACAVRLAPSVHGVGDHGFVPRLAGIARDKGVSAYLGDGRTAGQRYTAGMRRACSCWRLTGPMQAPSMPSPRKASRSRTSLRQSGVSSVCRSRAWPLKRLKRSSDGSRPSWALTRRPAVHGPAKA